MGEPVLDFVMPVYNEGANIGRALEEIYSKVELEKRVLVVYDFEEDDTVPVVRSLVDRYPGLELVRNRLGRGALNAIRAGIDASRAEIVVVTMADLSDDIRIVPDMVRLIGDEGYDVVCASRYMRGGRQIGGPPVKNMLSRFAGVSLHHLAGIPTHDATNSFRAYRRSLFDEIEIESRGGFELALEVTGKAFVMGKRVTELPSTWHDRVAGESRFQLLAWLPSYLHWYFFVIRNQPRLRRRV